MFTYGLRASLMSRAAAWWCGTLAVITCQQGIQPWKNWKHVLLERLTSPLVDLYIGVSQACCRGSAALSPSPPCGRNTPTRTGSRS